MNTSIAGKKDPGQIMVIATHVMKKEILQKTVLTTTPAQKKNEKPKELKQVPAIPAEILAIEKRLPKIGRTDPICRYRRG